MRKKIICLLLSLTIVTGVTTINSKKTFAYDKATLQKHIDEHELYAAFADDYITFTDPFANLSEWKKYTDSTSSISDKLDQFDKDPVLQDIVEKYVDLQRLHDFYSLENARLSIEGKVIKQIATQELAKGNKLGADTILNTYNKKRDEELKVIEKYTDKSTDVYNNPESTMDKLMSNITDDAKRQYLYAKGYISIYMYYYKSSLQDSTMDYHENELGNLFKMKQEYINQFDDFNFKIDVPQTKAEADEYIQNNTFTLKDYLFIGYNDGIPYYYNAYTSENKKYSEAHKLLIKIKQGSADASTINKATTLISQIKDEEIRDLYIGYITPQSYKLNGYNKDVPIYTSTNTLINHQLKNTEKAIISLINNQDNYELYDLASEEIDKLSNKAVKDSYQKVLTKYWSSVGTPYVRQFLTKLSDLQKNKNLYDWYNLCNLIDNSPLKTKKDTKYNQNYLHNKLYKIPADKLYLEVESTAYQNINGLYSAPTKENVQKAKNSLKLVKNAKTLKWLTDELTKVENMYYNKKNTFNFIGFNDCRIPVFTSNIATKNKQFKTIEKYITSLARNEDNYELYDLGSQEINKVTDPAVKTLYKSALNNQLINCKTEYVLNITDNLALFEKDKNLADYNRILSLINNSPLKQKRDDKYNKAYFTRVLYKSSQVAHLYNKESINAINLINKACKSPTKANIQAARNAVKFVKHPKTVKWLKDEITIIEKRINHKK